MFLLQGLRFGLLIYGDSTFSSICWGFFRFHKSVILTCFEFVSLSFHNVIYKGKNNWSRTLLSRRHMKTKLVLCYLKVKPKDSQWWCAISYFNWIVISTACSTKLELFQCPKGKNKNRKKRKKKPTNLNRPTAPSRLPAEPDSLPSR